MQITRLIVDHKITFAMATNFLYTQNTTKEKKWSFITVALWEK